MKNEQITSDLEVQEQTDKNIKLLKNGAIALDNLEDSVAQNQTTTNHKNGLLYTLEDDPPWSLTILLGIQHFFMMIVGSISTPFILSPLLCIPEAHTIRGTILSAIIFTSGLLTLLQTTLGARLPIVQGPSFSYLIPTMALIEASYPPCDSIDFSNMTQSAQEDVYLTRIREIQGSIAVACLFQVVVGFSGLVSFLISWLSPLTLVPIIGLIGLSLFDIAADKAGVHWGVAALTIFMMVLFSQFLNDTSIPLPAYTRSKGFYFRRIYIFKLFPVLLTLVLSWFCCYILTVLDILPKDSEVRTDTRLSIVENTAWFHIPYPLQFGMPTISLAGVLGILSGVIVSMAESIGDYIACAELAEAPPPPKHAINRGLGMEGLGSIFSALTGACIGLTSFSQNVGAIWITRVGSRRVILACAFVMMLVGVMGKLCGLFVTIPTPVVGGVFVVLFSLITSVGLANLKMVDLHSSRNLFVLGFSIFLGLAIPKWMIRNSDLVQTTYPSLNQLIVVLLSTPTFVGGLIGIVLDNTIAGTREERGLTKWNDLSSGRSNENKTETKKSVYDLPFGMNFIKKLKCCTRCPSSPTFASVISDSRKEKWSQDWNKVKMSFDELKNKAKTTKI